MPGTNAGRKSAPVSLKLLEGRSPGRDSGGRLVAPPPNFRRIPPEKPDTLSPDASTVWDIIVRDLSSQNLLKPMDGPALEMGCETYARWKAAVRMRQAQSHEDSGILSVAAHQGSPDRVAKVAAPWIGIEERASKDFRAWCAEFGLSVAAEAKIVREAGGGDAGGESPFA